MNKRLAKILQEARVKNRKIIKVDDGSWLRVDYIPFLGWLQGTRLPVYMQRDIGAGKRPLPAEFVWAEYKMPNKPGVWSLQDLGAVGSAFEVPEVEEVPEPVQLAPLWKELQEAAYQNGLENGGDSEEFFFNHFLPTARVKDPNLFPAHMGSISYDVGQEFEYSLSGRVRKLYQEYLDAIASPDGYEASYSTPTRRGLIKERLGNSYSSGWLEGVQRDWRKVLKGGLRLILPLFEAAGRPIPWDERDKLIALAKRDKVWASLVQEDPNLALKVAPVIGLFEPGELQGVSAFAKKDRAFSVLLDSHQDQALELYRSLA